jgi:hypothetical protein
MQKGEVINTIVYLALAVLSVFTPPIELAGVAASSSLVLSTDGCGDFTSLSPLAL